MASTLSSYFTISLREDNKALLTSVTTRQTLQRANMTVTKLHFFFLRYFAEGPGLWMDVFAGQHSYFSQHVVQLAHTSTLVRYAACAVAAKQLGQMKDPILKIRQTNCQRLMLRAFSKSRLDFLWYGAKYYEKAIQLLAKQLSHDDHSIPGLSPCCIYQTGLTPVSNDLSFHDEREEAASLFQIITACILCQYEDLSATMRAWSGHINGIYKLLQSHIHASSLPISFPMPLHVPQPMRALEITFWFFALHDMSEACEFLSLPPASKPRIFVISYLTWTMKMSHEKSAGWTLKTFRCGAKWAFRLMIWDTLW